MSIVTRSSFETGVHAHLQRPANVGHNQKAGTQVEAGSTPTSTDAARINAVLRELLKDGKAEVSDLSIRDIARLHDELGWEGEPRFEFTDGDVFVSAPGRRRRTKAATPSAPTTPSTPPASDPSSPAANRAAAENG